MCCVFVKELLHFICVSRFWRSVVNAKLRKEDEDEDEERQNATLDDFEFGHLLQCLMDIIIMNKPTRYNHFWAQRRSKCSLYDFN